MGQSRSDASQLARTPRAFLHPTYTCMVPFQDTLLLDDLLQISDDVKNRLDESHKEILFDELAIGVCRYRSYKSTVTYCKFSTNSVISIKTAFSAADFDGS